MPFRPKPTCSPGTFDDWQDATQPADSRPGNRNKAGGEKKEHEAEFYDGDKDQD